MNEKTSITSESISEINLKIKKPTLKYLTEFIRLKCAPDLLKKKLFPNAKEITESMSSYSAYRSHLMNILSPKDPNIRCIVVGDGHTPRTGALFAYRTNWKVISIDPFMREKNYNIKRLTIIKDRIENVDFDLNCSPVLIVCVHSHALLSNCIKSIKHINQYIINIPCCVKPDLNYNPDITYNDNGIFSLKNKIEIYKPF